MTVLVKGLCLGAERVELLDEEGTCALVLHAFYLVESRDKGSVTSQCLSSSVETGLGKAVSGAMSGACPSLVSPIPGPLLLLPSLVESALEAEDRWLATKQVMGSYRPPVTADIAAAVGRPTGALRWGDPVSTVTLACSPGAPPSSLNTRVVRAASSHSLHMSLGWCHNRDI